MTGAIRLTHTCNRPGCVGMPGSEIKVTKENKEFAATLVKRGGAVRVAAEAESDDEGKPQTASKPKPSTADKPKP